MVLSPQWPATADGVSPGASAKPDPTEGVSPGASAEFDPADGLPGWVYADPEVFDREMAAIFRHTWQYVGRAEQVAAPGRYLTATVGREPLIVLRAEDGQLRAFHNVCPHRGARILAGAGSCGKLIVCPYHAWSFTRTGAVHKVPHQEDHLAHLDTSLVGLRPASVAVWRGFLFASPDPGAEPFADYFAGFGEFLDGYSEPYEQLRQVAQFDFDEPVNWKLLVENYAEDYHFAFVHPRTLKVFDFDAVRTLPTGRHTRVLMPYRQQPPAGPSKYPWDPSGPSQQGYVFPGTTFQTARNHVSLFRLVPVGPTRTIIEIPVFQTPAQAERFPVDLAELHEDISNDMEEDFVICRQLQANVLASEYRIGALAVEHELGVAHFQRVWRSYLGHLLPDRPGGPRAGD